MTCDELYRTNLECEALYGADCRTANTRCVERYGGMNCADSNIVCNEIKGEDCPLANPKCEDEWSMTCVGVNNVTKENYLGLDYAELRN